MLIRKQMKLLNIRPELITEGYEVFIVLTCHSDYKLYQNSSMLFRIHLPEVLLAGSEA